MSKHLLFLSKEFPIFLRSFLNPRERLSVFNPGILPDHFHKSLNQETFKRIRNLLLMLIISVSLSSVYQHSNIEVLSNCSERGLP